MGGSVDLKSDEASLTLTLTTAGFTGGMRPKYLQKGARNFHLPVTEILHKRTTDTNKRPALESQQVSFSAQVFL